MSEIKLDYTSNAYLDLFCRQKDCQTFRRLPEDVQEFLANEAVKRLKLNKGNLKVCYMIIICYYMRDLSENDRRGPRAIALLISRINDNHRLGYEVVMGNDYGASIGWKDGRFFLTAYSPTSRYPEVYEIETDDRIDMIIAIFQLYNDQLRHRVTEITTPDYNPVYLDEYGMFPSIDKDNDDAINTRRCIDCIKTLLNPPRPEAVSECEDLVHKNNCAKDFILKPVRG